MTKEITKAIIIQEIQDKFKLRDYEAAAFLFDETVVPVYEISPHLERHHQTYNTMSITGTGPYLFYTVPETEKWIFSRYDVVFMGAGAYTVAGVFTDRIEIATRTVYLDLTAAQSASYHVHLPTPVTLGPGDRISVNVDGYTSTQDLRLYLDYMVEEIR